MAKTSKVWFRQQTGWWMTTVSGEQVKLAKGKENKKEAEKAFHTLMAHGTRAEDDGPRPTLQRVVGLFLDEAKRTKSAETYEVQRRYLMGFCDAVGKAKNVPDLRVHHVKDWVNADKTSRDKHGHVAVRQWGRPPAGSPPQS